MIITEMNENNNIKVDTNEDDLTQQSTTNSQSSTEETSVQGAMSDKMADEQEPDVYKKLEELNDTHLRLRAEFENYRRRTLKEKAELIKNGGETALVALLPVIDDLERALQNIRQSDDVAAIKEGVELICNKFVAYLAQQGVKPIEAIGQPFDVELFEAIATIPAPDESMKDKVIDCVQTGYRLYDKIIRHAKVVVGE
jgi:molecular chaperone GrpE